MPKSEAAKILSVGAAATVLGGAWKFSEFLYKAKRVRDVGPANAVYVRLINRVRSDLDEVKRLLTVPEVKAALRANKPKAEWVYGAMRDTRGALENITPLTERVGGDVEGGRRIGIRHRLNWLLSEQEKLENREKELVVAHSSLNEVIGFLTALEPMDTSAAGQYRDTNVDIQYERGQGRVEERDIYIEKHSHGPRRVEERDIRIEKEGGRRVEERDIYIEREHGPRRSEHRSIHVEHERGRGPGRVEEREVWVERGRDPRYDDRHFDGHRGRVEERELHIERDPRHVEIEYHERGPGHYEEKRYEERRFQDGRSSRHSDEDRVPQRENFMQSDVRRPSQSPYGEYAEYGAPQPSGAAVYRNRIVGDPGFGDEEVIDPQPVPPVQRYQQEYWVEEKQDFRVDKYGNRLPDRLMPTRYPRSHL